MLVAHYLPELLRGYPTAAVDHAVAVGAQECQVLKSSNSAARHVQRLECEKDYDSRYRAVKAVANKLGIGVESLRVWVKNADTVADRASAVPAVKSEREKELEREVRELRRANDILKAAASFFARELDPPLR